MKLCSEEIRALVFFFFFFFFLQRNDFVFLEIIAALKILVQTRLQPCLSCAVLGALLGMQDFNSVLPACLLQF